MKLLRWRTSSRHVRKYGYAAQPAWHVCILCCTTSMYIDPGFAQLLAFIILSIHSSFSSVESSRGFFPYILAPRRETDDNQRHTARYRRRSSPKEASTTTP